MMSSIVASAALRVSCRRLAKKSIAATPTSTWTSPWYSSDELPTVHTCIHRTLATTKRSSRKKYNKRPAHSPATPRRPNRNPFRFEEVPLPEDLEVLASYPPDAEELPPRDQLPPPDPDDVLRARMEKQWRPGLGLRKRPLKVSFDDDHRTAFSGEYEPLDPSTVPPPMWNPRLHKRCGALALKLGMMPVWDDWGVRHPCTVLFLDHNVVLRVKSSDGVDGYDAVVLGAGEYKPKNVNKPLRGIYEQCGVSDHPPYIVREFRITSETEEFDVAEVRKHGWKMAPEVGTRIHARHFLAGQCVDVAGISKGKGFQGAMKRHNFAGMPATHGTSKSHRALGSTGQCQDPGKVFKGKKMAGRMGTDRVTVQNLRIIKIDRGRNLIYVRGAVPGNRGHFVEIRDAIKKPLFGTEKVEEGRRVPFLPTFEYEEGVDGSGEKGFEVMKPLEETDPELPMEDAA